MVRVSEFGITLYLLDLLPEKVMNILVKCLSSLHRLRACKINISIRNVQPLGSIGPYLSVYQHKAETNPILTIATFEIFLNMNSSYIFHKFDKEISQRKLSIVNCSHVSE